MPGSYSNLLYHLVFSTKARQPIISDRFREDLYKYMGGIVRGEGGVLIEIGGIADHVHLLVKLKPVVTLSDFMRVLKANSSKWVNEEKLKIRGFGWQNGYAAFTVSESHVPRIVKYIQNQEAHHRRITFQGELLTLLKKHKISFDERYLWD